MDEVDHATQPEIVKPNGKEVERRSGKEVVCVDHETIKQTNVCELRFVYLIECARCLYQNIKFIHLVQCKYRISIVYI